MKEGLFCGLMWVMVLVGLVLLTYGTLRTNKLIKEVSSINAQLLDWEVIE